jgi:hypothetical protein
MTDKSGMSTNITFLFWCVNATKCVWKITYSDNNLNAEYIHNNGKSNSENVRSNIFTKTKFLQNNRNICKLS